MQPSHVWPKTVNKSSENEKKKQVHTHTRTNGWKREVYMCMRMQMYISTCNK